MLSLSEKSQTSKTVSFYQQDSENVFKGTLSVALIKYTKAGKLKTKCKKKILVLCVWYWGLTSGP
jgi:hypothetical protein